MDVNEKQIGGNHYKTALQHWDLLPALGFGPEYYVGQATKYIARWRKKHGVADLRKGQHFVEKLAVLVEKNGTHFLRYGEYDRRVVEQAVIRHLDGVLGAFFDANESSPDERAVITTIIFASTIDDLAVIISSIDLMAAQSFIDGTYAGAHQGDKPAAVGFEFVRYGQDHASIIWRLKVSGQEIELPVDEPPSMPT